MDPDLAAAFAASTQVSTSKGIGANRKYIKFHNMKLLIKLFLMLYSVESRCKAYKD